MSFPCPTCDANTLFTLAPGYGRARGSVYTGRALPSPNWSSVNAHPRRASFLFICATCILR